MDHGNTSDNYCVTVRCGVLMSPSVDNSVYNDIFNNVDHSDSDSNDDDML